MRVNRTRTRPHVEYFGGIHGEETAHLNTTPTGGTSRMYVDEDTITSYVKIISRRLIESPKTFLTTVCPPLKIRRLRNPAVKASMFETLAEQAHPTALGVGLVSAIAGGEVSNLIDPSGSFGRGDRFGVDAHQALSGGLGAFGTELGMAGMTGTALGVEALPIVGAGAIGAVAGTEAQGGIYTALDQMGANSDTKQSLSDIGGGAVGGAVFNKVMVRL